MRKLSVYVLLSDRPLAHQPFEENGVCEPYETIPNEQQDFLKEIEDYIVKNVHDFLPEIYGIPILQKLTIENYFDVICHLHQKYSNLDDCLKEEAQTHPLIFNLCGMYGDYSDCVLSSCVSSLLDTLSMPYFGLSIMPPNMLTVSRLEKLNLWRNVIDFSKCQLPKFTINYYSNRIKTQFTSLVSDESSVHIVVYEEGPPKKTLNNNGQQNVGQNRVGNLMIIDMPNVVAKYHILTTQESLAAWNDLEERFKPSAEFTEKHIFLQEELLSADVYVGIERNVDPMGNKCADHRILYLSSTTKIMVNEDEIRKVTERLADVLSLVGCYVVIFHQKHSATRDSKFQLVLLNVRPFSLFTCPFQMEIFAKNFSQFLEGAFRRNHCSTRSKSILEVQESNLIVGEKKVVARRFINRGELLSFLRLLPTQTKNDYQAITQTDKSYFCTKGAPESCINHSCAPNSAVYFQDWTLRAVRNIFQGDEITFDYDTTEYIIDRPFNCLCQASACRKRIQGFSKRNYFDQQKMAISCSPYIQKHFRNLHKIV